MPIYIKIGGNKLACEEVHFDTPNPPDRSSGQATGKRQWGQLTVLHALDSTTTAFQALATNQVLPVVQLQFTKIDSQGSEQVYHVVHLGRTKVVGIQPHVTTNHGRFRGILFEYLDVDMVYRQISWTYGNGGKAVKDDWH